VSPAVRRPRELAAIERRLREALESARAERSSLLSERWGRDEAQEARSRLARLDGEIGSLEYGLRAVERERQLGELLARVRASRVVSDVRWVQEWNASGPRAQLDPHELTLEITMKSRDTHRIHVPRGTPAPELRDQIIYMLEQAEDDGGSR